MEKSLESGVSYLGRAVRIAVLWMAWISAGAVAFGIPHLLNEKRDIIAVLAGASHEAKIYVGIWILGSIILCALLLTTLRQVFGARKVSGPRRL